MRKRTVFIIIILFLIFISVVGILVWWLLSGPLDRPLSLEVTPTDITSEQEADTPVEEDNRTCNTTGVTKVLQIAIASPLEAGHPGADSIRLVVVDFDEVEAGILALPADLWVNTPTEFVDELGSIAPLNEIYLTAYENAPGNPDKVRTQKATQILAQTIVDEFGFVPNQYITISGDSFVDLIDTLDGITITLPTEIDASAENYGVFPSGEQTLDGAEVLNFVRMLYPNGVGPDTFGRLERQNMVVWALMDAILSPETWDNVPELIKDARSMVVTDLSINKANKLACMVEEVGSSVELFVVSDDMVSVDEEGRMIPDMDAIKDLIGQLEGD